MKSSIPAGVEQYLKEAGFSATEMLILTKIVEENALTLRELAGKTGKSTGVLDQAMRKLIQRKIVERKMLNGGPKFVLRSLDAILEWARGDLRQRRGEMDRKYENFEQYIGSLKIDGTRPDIEYFYGADGIENAYMKLTESGQEFLTITPIVTTIEDDPLREARVNLFRKRQYRKIFQRVLAPDSTLARRYQSRDMFEYRKTLLLPPSECTTHVELTVVGGTVACVDLQEQKGCLIHFADLAKVERENFEVQWARQLARDKGESTCEPVLKPEKGPIALRTRIASELREFILSKRSIYALCFLALMSSIVTYGLYRSVQQQNFERLRDKVESIASVGVLQINPKDVEAVHTIDDIKKPEYARLVAILDLIRRSDPDLQYAYIMRKTDNPKHYAFVADADSLDPFLKKDINLDGVIDASDSLNYPGELYDTEQFSSMHLAFDHPMSDFGHDQWGDLFSGFAPIRDASGNAIAILGVDMFARKLHELTLQTFSPVFIFILCFLLFGFVRFMALNKSLVWECCRVAYSRLRLLILWVVFLSLLCVVLWYGSTKLEQSLEVRRIGGRLQSIAMISAVNDFDPADLDQLHIAGDMKKDAYQRVYKQLNLIRKRNPEDVTFAYIFRPTEDPTIFEFIADADANWNLPAYSPVTINDKNVAGDDIYENVWPGFMYYDPTEKVYSSAVDHANFGMIDGDQWGFGIAGIAPIKVKGKTVAILSLESVK